MSHPTLSTDESQAIQRDVNSKHHPPARMSQWGAPQGQGLSPAYIPGAIPGQWDIGSNTTAQRKHLNTWESCFPEMNVFKHGKAHCHWQFSRTWILRGAGNF
jgi:hypothetical protein